MPSREELWELLQMNGAETRDSMSKKISMLLVGEGYGETKLNYAIKNSVPTLSLPMAEFLGLLSKQGNVLVVDPQLRGVLPNCIIVHAFIIELLYGQFVRLHGRRDPRARDILGCVYQLSAGFIELLYTAWGDPNTSSSKTPGGLSELIQSLEGIRAEAERGLATDSYRTGPFEGA